MSKIKLEELLAAEGAAAEDYELPDRMPEEVTVSRPGLGRGSVVSVRLSVDEQQRLQQAASVAGLPVSTLIRIWALDRLRSERDDTGGSVAERVARLEREVFKRSA